MNTSSEQVPFLHADAQPQPVYVGTSTYRTANARDTGVRWGSTSTRPASPYQPAPPLQLNTCAGAAHEATFVVNLGDADYVIGAGNYVCYGWWTNRNSYLLKCYDADGAVLAEMRSLKRGWDAYWTTVSPLHDRLMDTFLEGETSTYT